MTPRRLSSRSLLVLAGLAALCVAAAGDGMTPGGKYKRNDMSRPRPPVVDPGTASTADRPGKPPSDAVVLLGEQGLVGWTTEGTGPDRGKRVPPRWTVENGVATVRGGTISHEAKFGDAQVHVEWASPAEVKGSSQGRGNSGVYLGGHGEIQVLDSFDNDTYPDGQAGALYAKYPPLVNASRKPGEWQTYDIILHVARTDENGRVIAPAKLTVLHNGVVVHHATDTLSTAKEWSMTLQDHGNPVRYRNIWVRRLKGYDEK